MPYPLEPIGDGSPADRNFSALARDMNPPVPQARVYNSANIGTVSGTPLVLTFDSERYDSAGLHSTSANTSRLTAPITGLYVIQGYVEFAGNTAGDRFASIRLNGATNIGRMAQRANAGAGNPAMLQPHATYQLVAGDYVEIVVLQDSGGALNVNASANYSPEFSMVRLGGYVNVGV